MASAGTMETRKNQCYTNGRVSMGWHIDRRSRRRSRSL